MYSGPMGESYWERCCFLRTSKIIHTICKENRR
nr:MAG TPA: hypothetical protein [Caudoviricetes sp.]